MMTYLPHAHVGGQIEGQSREGILDQVVGGGPHDLFLLFFLQVIRVSRCGI